MAQQMLDLDALGAFRVRKIGNELRKRVLIAELPLLDEPAEDLRIAEALQPGADLPKLRFLGGPDRSSGGRERNVVLRPILSSSRTGNVMVYRSHENIYFAVVNEKPGTPSAERPDAPFPPAPWTLLAAAKSLEGSRREASRRAPPSRP